MTEEELLKKRFQELAEKSYRSSIYTFTNFLAPAEQDLFWRMEQELSYAGTELFGGTKEAERQIVRFGSPAEFGYEEAFPITCIVVEPLIKKFSGDLTHRDFLGALMNLGIERDTLGDIHTADKTGYIFCLSKIADYIIENLTRVGRTHVRAYETAQLPEAVKPKLVEYRLIVSSVRLDAVIAKQYHLSRSQSLLLFQTKKVFVNGRQCESNSYLCREGDVISVRGYGKLIFDGIPGTTGKGRLNVRVLAYE